MNNKISVIMPVKNAEQTIHKAVLSVLQNTHKNIEFLIIDNYSSDNSLKKIKNIKDSRIKVFRRKGNLSEILNFGIANSSGDFIARMDADDVCVPQRFEHQIEHMHKTNSDIIGSSIYIKYKNSTKIKTFQTENIGIKTMFLFNNELAHPSILGKKKFFKQNLYSPNFSKAQDYDLWTRLALTSCKFCNLIDPYLYYTFNEENYKKNSKGLYFSKKIKYQYVKNILKLNRVNFEITNNITYIHALFKLLFFSNLYFKLNKHLLLKNTLLSILKLYDN